MKKSKLKLIFTILVSFILLVMLSPIAKAANGDLELVKAGEDYIVYVEGYEDKEFEFAFSNVKMEDVDNLTFTNNWTDSNDVNVAGLDSEMGVDLNEKVYIWIKDAEGNFVVDSKEVYLDSALYKDEIAVLEKLTKLIDVDLTQSNVTEEIVDGVKITRTTGKVVILPDETDNYKYSYDLIRVEEVSEGVESTVVDLLTMIDELNSKYEDMTMVEKIRFVKNANLTLDNLMQSANWKDVQNMEILQPEESVEGDKYIVLLEKSFENGVVASRDVQILDCYEEEKQEKVTEQVPVKVVTKLPVTGEDITLYVILGIVVIIIIAVIIRMIMIKKNGKNEK